MNIRRYLSTDKDAVWNLHIAAMQSVGALLGDGPWNDDWSDIEGVYLRNHGEFLVGTNDRQVIACGAFRRIDNATAEIKRMRVQPSQQRHGHGQAIYDRLESTARELGYTKLILDTSTEQLAAQHFYARNGYRETGRTKVQWLEVILYEKHLLP